MRKPKYNFFALGFVAAFMVFIFGIFLYAAYEENKKQRPNESRIEYLERRLAAIEKGE